MASDRRIARRDPGVPAPLSFAQERLWFLDQLQPGRPAYCLPAVCRLTGPLDAGALRASLGEIVRRHEALRTRFAIQAGRPVQVVDEAGDFPLARADLSTLAPAAAEAAYRRRLEAAVHEPFRLDEGPLFRAALVRLGPADHRLVLALHHAVADAWSIRVLGEELAALYAARVTGVPAALAELPVQYADYAVWQRRRFEEPRAQAQLERWARTLRGPLPVLRLPSDRGRPAVLTDRGAAHRRGVPESLLAAVRERAAQLRVTPFALLLTAFDVLLYRYTGEPDVVVGTTVANRTRVELEPMIGFFANTLALRTDLGGDPTFAQAVGRVRDTVLAALGGAEVPFEKVVEAARPSRRLDASPLFQVLFMVQDVTPPAASAGGVRMVTTSLGDEVAQYEVTLGMSGRAWRVSYNADVLEADFVASLAEHLEALIASATRDPEQPIRSLELVSRPRLDRLARGPRDPEPPRPAPELIAEAPPGAEAAVCGADRVAYGELDRRAARLARVLRGRGAGLETRIGIVMDRSVRRLVAMLGTWKAGAAAVPFEPDTPPARLAAQLRSASVRLALTDGAEVPAGVDTLLLDREGAWERLDDRPVALPEIPGGAAAYVIHTSGSTGEPKGVVVSHAALSNFALHVRRAYGLGAGDRVLHQLPCAVDQSLAEMIPALVSGAAVVLVEPGRQRDPDHVADLIARERVTMFGGPPALLDVLLDRPGAARWTAVRHVFSGGDVLTPGLVRRVLDRVPGAALHNAYGPTETTVGVVYRRCTPASAERRWPPVGRPIANTTAYVLDRDLRPVPPGVLGELYVGGAPVARGYLDLPGPTAAGFLPDPFGPSPGGRMYATGDVARWLPDGDVVVQGRADDQVKIRGMRVEPREIAAVLNRQPDVRDSVVVLQERGLVAYVVPEPGASPAAGELRAALAAWLPPHMLPAAIVPLERLPLLANGKLDRDALPEPLAEPVELAPDAAPATDVERAVARAWEAALGVPRVGLHDNFFDLGGHSLLMVEVRDRIQEALGAAVQLLDLFTYPTVSGLARHLGGGVTASARAAGREQGARERQALTRIRERRERRAG
jgi:amino acid adenylation domain-containing protein